MAALTTRQNVPQRKHMEEEDSSKLFSKLIYTGKKKRKRKVFLLHPVLSRTTDSASSKKGRSDVQNNDDGFKAVIVLSCVFREKIFNHRLWLPESKQEHSDISKTGWMFLALFLLAICFVPSFLLGFLTFSSSLPHLTHGQVIISPLSCHPPSLFYFAFYLVNPQLS